MCYLVAILSLLFYLCHCVAICIVHSEVLRNAYGFSTMFPVESEFDTDAARTFQQITYILAEKIQVSRAKWIRARTSPGKGPTQAIPNATESLIVLLIASTAYFFASIQLLVPYPTKRSENWSLVLRIMYLVVPQLHGLTVFISLYLDALCHSVRCTSSDMRYSSLSSSTRIVSVAFPFCTLIIWMAHLDYTVQVDPFCLALLGMVFLIRIGCDDWYESFSACSRQQLTHITG